MVGAVLSLFLLVTKRLYGKDREWSIGQIKTCRKKQHVKIDDIKEMSDLICGKAAVVGNYNSTRDNQSSNCKQFSECNKKLKEAVENDPDLKSQFSEEQIEDIENGRTPRGYTWHHTEEPGKMQLVKTEDHDKRIGGAAHTGGNSIWGNKSVDKGIEENEQKGEAF